MEGYISSKRVKISESELVKQINEIVGEKPIEVEEHFEFKDIHIILEDDLFKSFVKKLKQKGYSEERKKQLRELVIKAMMKAKKS